MEMDYWDESYHTFLRREACFLYICIVSCLQGLPSASQVIVDKKIKDILKPIENNEQTALNPFVVCRTVDV